MIKPGNGLCTVVVMVIIKIIVSLEKVNPKPFDFQWKKYQNRSGVLGRVKKRDKSGIGDLRDKDWKIKTETSDKANMFNDFFASVFTQEDKSGFPDKLDPPHFLSVIIISQDNVFKYFNA